MSDGPGGAGGSGVVSGSATDTLTITSVSTADAGDYTVLISNPCGEVESTPAIVGVFCSADFNHSGLVNSTDVSDFINAWFEDLAFGTLVTDFDHNAIVNSTDVGEFINQWFEDTTAGCG